MSAYQVTVTAIGSSTSYFKITTDELQGCTVTSIAYPAKISLGTELPGYVVFIHGVCKFSPSIEVKLPCGSIALAPGQAVSTTCYVGNLTYLVRAYRGLPAPALLAMLLSLKSPRNVSAIGRSNGRVSKDFGEGLGKRNRRKTQKACSGIWR